MEPQPATAANSAGGDAVDRKKRETELVKALIDRKTQLDFLRRKIDGQSPQTPSSKKHLVSILFAREDDDFSLLRRRIMHHFADRNPFFIKQDRPKPPFDEILLKEYIEDLNDKIKFHPSREQSHLVFMEIVLYQNVWHEYRTNCDDLIKKLGLFGDYGRFTVVFLLIFAGWKRGHDPQDDTNSLKNEYERIKEEYDKPNFDHILFLPETQAIFRFDIDDWEQDVSDLYPWKRELDSSLFQLARMKAGNQGISLEQLTFDLNPMIAEQVRLCLNPEGGEFDQ